VWNAFITQEDVRETPAIEWLKEVVELAETIFQRILADMQKGNDNEDTVSA
jgi:hypothetical protein